MVDILKEYYGLNIDYYEDYNEGIIFFINGDYFYFFATVLNEEEVNKSIIYIELLLRSGIKMHEYVRNNIGNIVSKEYVLIKLNHFKDDVALEEVINFNIKVDNQTSELFHNKWRSRIDYIEYQLSELSENKLVNNSFDYFIGIAEQLMIFLENNYKYESNNYLVHRLFSTLSNIEFYNPINVIVGNRYKDVSSYISLNNDWDLLNAVLNEVDESDKVYLFVRLSFPFKYFNYINQYVVGDSEKELDIKRIVDDIDKYESYLKKIDDIFGFNVFYWIKKDN